MLAKTHHALWAPRTEPHASVTCTMHTCTHAHMFSSLHAAHYGYMRMMLLVRGHVAQRECGERACWREIKRAGVYGVCAGAVRPSVLYGVCAGAVRCVCVRERERERGRKREREESVTQPATPRDRKEAGGCKATAVSLT